MEGYLSITVTINNVNNMQFIKYINVKSNLLDKLLDFLIYLQLRGVIVTVIKSDNEIGLYYKYTEIIR